MYEFLGLFGGLLEEEELFGGLYGFGFDEGLLGGLFFGGLGGVGWVVGIVFEIKLFLILIVFLCKL